LLSFARHRIYTDLKCVFLHEILLFKVFGNILCAIPNSSNEMFMQQKHVQLEVSIFCFHQCSMQYINIWNHLSRSLHIRSLSREIQKIKPNQKLKVKISLCWVKRGNFTNWTALYCHYYCHFLFSISAILRFRDFYSKSQWLSQLRCILYSANFYQKIRLWSACLFVTLKFPKYIASAPFFVCAW